MVLEAPKVWRLGDAISDTHPHHAGIKALWETKWKFPCTKSIYPFHDGKFEDFEPVFTHLIENEINDPMNEAYTSAFIPPAKSLAERAAKAASEKESTELYLRACCLLRIARFPYISQHVGMNTAQTEAWSLQKDCYISASAKWEVPVKEVFIPFESHTKYEGETIPAYLRLARTTAGKKAPVMLLMTGLDGYRPDNSMRLDMFLARGWASITCEIPGTADCPADPSDPESPDRLWSAVLKYIKEHEAMDETQVLVWGLSAGGYYAVRIAHTHKDLIKGSVAQGAGTHYFFAKEWLEHAGKHEYPFELFPFLPYKYGYKTAADYISNSQAKFSLLETGILDKPSTQLLLVNGTRDGLMPIEDSVLCLERGNAKSARFFDGCLHMGYPTANTAVFEWLDELTGGGKT